MRIYRSRKSERGILETYDRLLELWGTDYQERDIMTNYGTTHVIVAGKENSCPLVLFHGVGDDSALMWFYNAKELAKHFCIYAIDTLGGPGKSRPNKNYDKGFDDAVWMNEVLDGLGLDIVNLAGVSEGAYLVQYYTLIHPERVNKVICMAGCVPTGEKNNALKIMMKIFLPEALFPTDRNIRRIIQKLAGENARVFLDHSVIMEHYRFLLKGFNNMAMSYHKLVPFQDKQIDEIRDKIHYLVGERDPFAIMGGKDVLIKYHMNSTFFPGVGHGINHEIADTINQIIIKEFTLNRMIEMP